MRALGILNVDAGIYAVDARSALFVVQELLLLLQSTKTPCTDSLENSLFHAKFSEIDSESAVLAKNTKTKYAAMVFMAPWWLTSDYTISAYPSQFAIVDKN